MGAAGTGLAGVGVVVGGGGSGADRPVDPETAKKAREPGSLLERLGGVLRRGGVSEGHRKSDGLMDLDEERGQRTLSSDSEDDVVLRRRAQHHRGGRGGGGRGGRGGGSSRV